MASKTKRSMSREEQPSQPPKKRASRNPTARKQAIIDAAADLISREGSSRITNRKVADYAGVPLGSTTQYFKSIDELRRAGLAELAKRIEREYDDVFKIVAHSSEKNASGRHAVQDANKEEGQIDSGSSVLAEAINEYLSNPKRVNADAALYAAAIDDPEVRSITKDSFESFLERCKPYMDVSRAKILFAFTEGAVINSCFMGVPYDTETIRKAVSLILSDA